jgi:SAM-dependent methyltransferase
MWAIMAPTNGPTGTERRPYREAARYYKARPPYSAELRPALARKLGWDGTGRLLDIGCGPGVVALELAPSFSQVVGVDPEESMLMEARGATPASAMDKVCWVQARAENIPALNLGRFQAVTLAQSFHWTDRDSVAEIVYDLLVPSGSMLLIHHEAPSFGPGLPSKMGIGEPSGAAQGTAHPPVPHEVIEQVLVGWLGRGKPPPDPNREPYHDLLARTRFGPPERLLLPGRADLIRTVDEVIDNYLSTSFAAPDLFGDHLPQFRSALANELRRHTDTGCFWEWPGDTEVLIAIKKSGHR